MGLWAADRNEALRVWFAAHGRDLAFRRTQDPYAVLVAEVMLQQTQVARVEAAWIAFMDRFPTVEALAVASPADVIRSWADLGYYGRARRLQRAARLIVERHGGRVPSELPALEALPGIGRYTARAVAAIGFGRPVAALDTNIARVVRRLVANEGTHPPVRLQLLADGLVDPIAPGDWTHAMMDVGATLCRPREPRCGECPLRAFCRTATVAGRAVSGERGQPARAERRRDAGPALRSRTPFRVTRRWLRGRIMARLRAASDGEWIALEGPFGEHPPGAVREALGQLAAEGLLELNAAGRARLPHA